MKLIAILGFIFACLSNINSIKIKSKKSKTKLKKQYYNGNPTYNPGYQAPQSYAYPQYPQAYPIPNMNYGYAMRAGYNENLIDITRSQTDKPIKITNVL